MQLLFDALISNLNSSWPKIVRLDAHYLNKLSVAYRFRDSSEFNFIVTLVSDSNLEVQCTRLQNGVRVNESITILENGAYPLLTQADGISRPLNMDLSAQAEYVIEKIDQFFDSPAQQP